MGEREKYVGRGRYGKGGGQQVASLFAESTDNEKIKAVYGNYGFWSWLRYWYLDTENFVTFMLADKGYYDYDYEAVKKKKELTAEDKEIWSADKLDAVLGVKRRKPIPLTAEEMQRIAMEEQKLKDHD